MWCSVLLPQRLPGPCEKEDGRLIVDNAIHRGRRDKFRGSFRGARETEQQNVPMKVATCTGEETSEAKVSRTKFTTELMDMLREDHSGVFG